VANHSQFGFNYHIQLVAFHHHALIVALAICVLVLYLLALIVIEKLSSNTVDAQEVELM
ncbi:COX2 oxidase, partial [Anhinga anhinga]|nr:COX2 oxidase [Anhinga anhinga]